MTVFWEPMSMDAGVGLTTTDFPTLRALPALLSLVLSSSWAGSLPASVAVQAAALRGEI